MHMKEVVVGDHSKFPQGHTEQNSGALVVPIVGHEVVP